MLLRTFLKQTASNIYNKTHVDHIASSKQSSLSFSTFFNALNIPASGAIAASNYYTDGTVNASSMSVGSIIASNIYQIRSKWISLITTELTQFSNPHKSRSTCPMVPASNCIYQHTTNISNDARNKLFI